MGTYTARLHGTATNSIIGPTDALNWANPDNALAADGVYASSDDGGPLIGYTNRWLTLTMGTGGLSVPSSETVTGITVIVYGKAHLPVGTTITTNGIFLLDNNVVVGSVFGNGVVWLAVDSAIVHGGEDTLAGIVWTPAKVNADLFGMALSVTSTSGNAYALVDYVEVTVHTASTTGSGDDDDSDEDGDGGGGGGSFNFRHAGEGGMMRSARILIHNGITETATSAAIAIPYGKKVVIGHNIVGGTTGGYVTLTHSYDESLHFVPHHGDSVNAKVAATTSDYSTEYRACADFIKIACTITDGTHYVWYTIQ